jgi:predicted ATPase
VIDEFTARGFGCLTDVTVRLTPLHAFIGPNDSGKSTLLEAIRLVAAIGSRPPNHRSLIALLSQRCAATSELAVKSGAENYRLERPEDGRWLEHFLDWSQFVEGTQPLLFEDTHGQFESLSTALSSLRMVRLRPEKLRDATPLRIEGEPFFFLDEQGSGLASVLHEIRDRSEDAWRSLLDETRRLFPNVRRLQLQVREMQVGRGMTVAAEMLDGTRVPVEHLSEGFLYFLAFAALRHLDPPSLLLIEEPENGLHPARIREVVRVLRDLSRSGTQVLLTTHSPLLLNELQADEITVLTRPPGGTRATRLSEVPRYRERAENDDLLPGEFWVNYCDGELEAPLLEPVDETSP